MPDSFAELVFDLDDSSYTPVELSGRLSCRIELLDTARSPDGETPFVQFVRVEEVSPSRFRAAVADEPPASTVEVIDRALVARLEPRNSVVETFVDVGLLPRTAVARNGAARLTAVLPPGRDANAVVSTVCASHPSLEPVGKRLRDGLTHLLTGTGLRTVVEEVFTERQWTALRLAQEGGYFERPRERSQSELAGRMGVSQKTFSQHLTVALRKLLGLVFDRWFAGTMD